jgi:integrase
MIVESSSMAAVIPPAITYRPHLAKEIISDGRFSDIQLERVIHAGRRHEQRLADGSRFRRAGVKALAIGAHAIRHAFATRLTQQGTSLKTIADLWATAPSTLRSFIRKLICRAYARWPMSGQRRSDEIHLLRSLGKFHRTAS